MTMSEDTTPKPPAGMRWREVTVGGTPYRFTSRLQVLIGDKWNDAMAVPPSHIPELHDLMQRNTEPLPAPAVDRNGEAWNVACNALVKAITYGDSTNPQWSGRVQETDAILRALAPHWRELAALAGETAETPKRGIEITDEHIEAGVHAYAETSAYWAPEVMHSPRHMRKLVERILAVVEDAS